MKSKKLLNFMLDDKGDIEGVFNQKKEDRKGILGAVIAFFVVLGIGALYLWFIDWFLGHNV